MTFGLRRAKMLGYLFMQLVSKIFNLCGHDPPTSQTDGQTDRQTDGQTTCDRKTVLFTIVHRVVKHDVIHKTGSTQRIATPSEEEQANARGYNAHKQFGEDWTSGF